MTYIDEEEKARDKKLAERAKAEHSTDELEGIKQRLRWPHYYIDHHAGLSYAQLEDAEKEVVANAEKRLASLIHQKELEARIDEAQSNLWVCGKQVKKSDVVMLEGRIKRLVAQLNKEREGK